MTHAVNTTIAYVVIVIALSACGGHSHDTTSDGGGGDGGSGSVVDAASTDAPPIVYECNSTTGLTQPLAVCSNDQPCLNSLTFTNGMISTTATVTTASDMPTCASSDGTVVDSGPAQWIDPDGTTRYYCVHTPVGASSSSLRPLVVYFHGSGGSVGDIYDNTNLRAKSDSFDLSGDPARPGFVIAAVQGRNLHWATAVPPGRHHDYLFRDMGTQSANPDIENADHLIDMIVATGVVDPKQIYVMGWSNGSDFSQMYAMARYAAPTPGGTNVAAAAVYGFSDPYGNISATQNPSCELDPYPMSKVPMYMVNRTCDALTVCDAAQAAAFSALPYNAEDWVNDGLLNPAVVNDTNVQLQLITRVTGASATACDAPGGLCTEATGTLAHLRWPYGPMYDSAYHDWEVDMLAFLAAHPHP